MIIVFWDRNKENDIYSYKVYRSSAREGSYTYIDTVIHPTNYYEDPDGTANSWYKISAVDTDGNESDQSLPISGGEAIEYAGVRVLLRSAFEIPVWDEMANFNATRDQAIFAYGNWNEDFDPHVYLNNVRLETGYTINYDSTIDFNSELDESDWVTASYKFAFFEPSAVNELIYTSLKEFNSFPPASNYTLTSLPEYYEPAVLYGAIRLLLQQMIFELNFKEVAIVFGEPDNPFDASKVIGHLETLKQNYANVLEKLWEAKKFGPYPRIYYAFYCGNTVVIISQIRGSLSNGNPELSLIKESVETLREISKFFQREYDKEKVQTTNILYGSENYSGMIKQVVAPINIGCLELQNSSENMALTVKAKFLKGICQRRMVEKEISKAIYRLIGTLMFGYTKSSLYNELNAMHLHNGDEGIVGALKKFRDFCYTLPGGRSRWSLGHSLLQNREIYTALTGKPKSLNKEIWQSRMVNQVTEKAIYRLIGSPILSIGNTKSSLQLKVS
jgi:hypothetical protein